MEIWTIREDWSILKEHKSFEEADKYEHPEAFQILYREGRICPIHVYRVYKN